MRFLGSGISLWVYQSAWLSARLSVWRCKALSCQAWKLLCLLPPVSSQDASADAHCNTWSVSFFLVFLLFFAWFHFDRRSRYTWYVQLRILISSHGFMHFPGVYFLTCMPRPGPTLICKDSQLHRETFKYRYDLNSHRCYPSGRFTTLNLGSDLLSSLASFGFIVLILWPPTSLVWSSVTALLSFIFSLSRHLFLVQGCKNTQPAHHQLADKFND